MSLSEAAFEALYRAQAPRVLAYLNRRVVPQDAPDLLAETFLVAWRRRDAVPPGDQAIPWLFVVARNLVLADHRRRADHPAVVDANLIDAGPPGPVRSGAPGESAGESDATAERVRAALAELGDLDRELVLLTVWDGLTPSQAAVVVGLSAVNARVRLHRARGRLSGRLRSLIEAPDAEPAPPSSQPSIARTRGNTSGTPAARSTRAASVIVQRELT